jgi:hypothetical protein
MKTRGRDKIVISQMEKTAARNSLAVSKERTSSLSTVAGYKLGD